MFNRAGPPEPRLNEPPRQQQTPPPPRPTGGFAPPPFATSPARSETPAAETASRPLDAPTSVLGADIRISGQQIVIRTQGSLLIAGHIQGDVQGETVTVGETGHVVGTITARTIAVQGEVSGALKGTTVLLAQTAKVDGDIIKQSLSIAEGAQFDGTVRRAKDAAEVTPDLA